MNTSPNFMMADQVLPSSNEAIIQMLGLGPDPYSNDYSTGKLLDDVVKQLDLDSFMLTPSGEPVAAVGFESYQGHQLVGQNLTNLKPCVSYLDVGSPSSPPEVLISPPHSPHNSVSSYLPEAAITVTTLEPLGLQQPWATPQEITPPVPVLPPAASTAAPGGGKAPRKRNRQPKTKLYEREEPLSDPEEEKKRQNAINAKLNRDKQKNRMADLEAQVKALTEERNTFQAANIKLKNKCEAFEKQLRNVCQQFNVPVIILPQD